MKGNLGLTYVHLCTERLVLQKRWSLMRGNLVWDICAFAPSKAGLTKRWSFTRVVSQKRYCCILQCQCTCYRHRTNTISIGNIQAYLLASP